MRNVLIRGKAVGFAILMLILTTGSQAMTSTSASDLQTPPPETTQVPLHFAGHNFEAKCYNTLRCSVVYNDHDFTVLDNNTPSPVPSSSDYRKNWGTATYLDIRAFSSPAVVKWTAKDGSDHEATVDFDKIFKDRLIWHKVPKVDMKDFYRGPYAGNPDIFLEVNDRTVNVFMTMLVPTKTEQIPGNKYSFGRDDLFLTWTHTY
ncbi:hypothetical protein ACPPVV_10560 [Rhodanobacter sp. Col0626]|uniref:hypothetical protein n=1 Tax=Rhodanobacter sp. Col0626 TaxID=3415679 RepID=UPI003CED0B2B